MIVFVAWCLSIVRKPLSLTTLGRRTAGPEAVRWSVKTRETRRKSRVSGSVRAGVRRGFMGGHDTLAVSQNAFLPVGGLGVGKLGGDKKKVRRYTYEYVCSAFTTLFVRAPLKTFPAVAPTDPGPSLQGPFRSRRSRNRPCSWVLSTKNSPDVKSGLQGVSILGRATRASSMIGREFVFARRRRKTSR